MAWTKKVKGMVEVLACHLTRSKIPSADRQTLTHSVKQAEHGKPNRLHTSVESDP